MEIETIIDFLQNELEDEIRDYVVENYESDIINVDDAKEYLGDLYSESEYKNMSDDEIIEAAVDLQTSYWSKEADFEEVFEKALELYENNQ